MDDRALFQRYLGDYKFKTYEYSFLTLYMWKKMCNVEYSIIDDVLIIKKSEPNKGEYFMQPIGYTKKNLKNVIDELLQYKEQCLDMQYLFRDIEIEFLEILKDMYDGNIEYIEDNNNFDYIYNTKDLIELPGKKFHSKKNHYNQFEKNYNYSIVDLHEEKVAKECLEFSEKWSMDKGEITDEILYEVDGIADIVSNINILNLKGMAVYVEDKVVGFTIGEQVNNKMAIIHIEKGNADYAGIYAFLNKNFVERFFMDTIYINREEDLGIEGLRKAKMSYHPAMMAKKYIINISR